MTRSLLSLIVRFVRLLPWCVHDVRCGGPFGEWRIYSFHKNELFASDQVQPGAWVCVGWGVSSQCLCFPEIGARYIPSDLAGSNICMMHLHTTTITTTTHNLATFCNFQFQSHSDGGGCPSATTCPCIASHRMYDIDRATDRHLLESGNTFHQSTSQSINLSISQRPGEGQRPPVFLSPVLSLCDGSAHSIAPCPPMSLASPVQPMEDRGL